MTRSEQTRISAAALFRLVPLALIFVLAACTLSFRVTKPVAGQASSQEYTIGSDRKLVIEVTFSEAVDIASMEARVNVRLTTETDANAPFSFALKTGEDGVVVITSTGLIDDLCSFNPDCSWSLEILGSGSSPVKSVSGKALDGDANGSPGGDYSTSFTLVG